MFVETSLTTLAYNLGPIEQIPLGEGRQFQVGALAVAVFRARTGQVFATQAMCPHQGGPLADGLVGAGKVICPLHAYKFDLATGQPIGHSCGALRAYRVDVSDRAEIWLTWDRGACE